MKRYILLVLITISIVSCSKAPAPKEEDAFGLNGVWYESAEILTKADIENVKKRIIEQYGGKSSHFSWGDAISVPNGSWWFDVGSKGKALNVPGGPEYEIREITWESGENTKIAMSIISKDLLEELIADNTMEEAIREKTHKVVFSYIDNDTLDFYDPDHVFGIYTVNRHYLYRIEGPKRR